MAILGGVNHTDNLPLKLPSTIYPKSSVRFTPSPEIAREDLPLKITKYDLPPKLSNFEQNFKRTQHHALLHKGLFCEKTNKPSFDLSDMKEPCDISYREMREYVPQVVSKTSTCYYQNPGSTKSLLKSKTVL